MASHRSPDGEHRALVTDPPVCSAGGSLAVLERPSEDIVPMCARECQEPTDCAAARQEIFPEDNSAGCAPACTLDQKNDLIRSICGKNADTALLEQPDNAEIRASDPVDAPTSP